MKKLLLTAFTCLTVVVGLQAQLNLRYFGIFPDDASKTTFTDSLKNSLSKRAKPPVIVHTIPSPTSSPIDIAFDGSDLWVEGYGDLRLYKISTVDGSVLKTIPTDVAMVLGLEFSYGHLWLSNADDHLIQQIDTSDGSVVNSIPAPAKYHKSYPAGLAWDGQDMWNNDPMDLVANPNDSIYKIDTTGKILQSRHAFGTYTTGLAWDGAFLWSSDNASLKIYKIKPSSFKIVDTVDAPGGYYPNGLAFDGKYLWVANNDTDSLYQLDISKTNTGMNENGEANNQDYFIYPNPAKDEVTLVITGNRSGFRYSITNLQGIEVLNGEASRQKTIIDIHRIQAGAYILQVPGMNRNFIKLIKK